VIQNETDTRLSPLIHYSPQSTNAAQPEPTNLPPEFRQSIGRTYPVKMSLTHEPQRDQIFHCRRSSEHVIAPVSNYMTSANPSVIKTCIQASPQQQVHYTSQAQNNLTNHAQMHATAHNTHSNTNELGKATLTAYPQHNMSHCHQFNPHNSNLSHTSMQEYHLLLEEAREIRFTGRRFSFIFYYNQISELIQRCSDPSCKMDLLQASCQEEAPEAISALVPTVPGWDSDTQIKRALE